MNKIIEKTYELIDILDNSEIIKDMLFYKNKIIDNKEIRELVKRYNETSLDSELVILKKQLYNYSDYKNYIYNYNKLKQIVILINYKYKKLLNNRRCGV